MKVSVVDLAYSLGVHQRAAIWRNKAGTTSLRNCDPCRRNTPTTTTRNRNFSTTLTSIRKKFDDIVLHPDLRYALVQAGLDVMTPVQAQTFDYICRGGQDVTARAHTGTGKTVAFLLPSIQRIIDCNDKRQTLSYHNKIRMLILSPTRELAQQIHGQAKQLTAHVLPPMHPQVMYGGVPKFVDIKRLQAQIPTILTATPGRLLDHINSTDLAQRKRHDDLVAVQSTTTTTSTEEYDFGVVDIGHHGANDDDYDNQDDDLAFRHLLSGVQILVLDEMDSLLDMGFRNTIRKILRHLSSDRQTLLFSATNSPAVYKMIRECVQQENVVAIDCIDQATTEPPSSSLNENNANISQSYVILPPDQVVWRTVQVLSDLMREPKNKLLVFFPTTAQVTFFARLFQHGLGQSVLEMHAQLTQARRSVVSDRFRHGRHKAVLLTTDVSSRGVDYPNVTHVVQVGVPSDRETFIHRSGRTGRAGRKGLNLLLLTPAEEPFLHDDLHGLPLEPNERFHRAMKRPLDCRLENMRMHVQMKMRDGQSSLLKENVQDVYEALLGYYTSRIRRWSKGASWQDQVVQLATEYCRQAGLSEMPNLNARLANQLGLVDHPGVLVRDRWANGRAFDVGRRQPKEDEEEGVVKPDVWSRLSPPRRNKSLQRERITNSSGLWEDEFDS